MNERITCPQCGSTEVEFDSAGAPIGVFVDEHDRKRITYQVFYACEECETTFLVRDLEAYVQAVMVLSVRPDVIPSKQIP